MKEIFILATLTSFSLVAFIILLVVGLIKSNKKLLISATVLFFLTIGFGTYTISFVFTKSFNKLSEITPFRNGNEIYDALFDSRENQCVNVIQYRDQVIPKIDGAIWMHFETCPNEMKRILSKKEFQQKKLSTKEKSFSVSESENMKWFNPRFLGDTVLVFEYSSEDSRIIQTIWSNTDSTEVFVRDIYD